MTALFWALGIGAILAGLLVWPRTGTPILHALHILRVVLSAVCGTFARGFDRAMFVNKRTGAIPRIALITWQIVNLIAVFGCWFLITSDRYQQVAVTLSLVIALEAVLIFSAGLLRLSEDREILDGIGDRRHRLLPDNSTISNDTIIVTSVFLLVLSLVVPLYAVDHGTGAWLANKPDTGVAHLDYLLCVLWAITPGRRLLGAVE